MKKSTGAALLRGALQQPPTHLSPKSTHRTTLYAANNREVCNFLNTKGRGDQDFTQPHPPSEQGSKPHTGTLPPHTASCYSRAALWDVGANTEVSRAANLPHVTVNMSPMKQTLIFFFKEQRAKTLHLSGLTVSPRPTKITVDAHVVIVD